MKKFILLFSVYFFLATESFAQDVVIPDAIFKAYLLAHPGINTNSDTEIQVSEAAAFTGQISVGFSAISDLTGIESFVNITSLQCVYASVAALDVSSNNYLTSLDLQFNGLTTLTLGNQPNLIGLNLTGNNLTTIDLSLCPSLSIIGLSDNMALSSLDISANPQLVNLSCNTTDIATLDLTSHPLLESVECCNCQISSLSLSSNPLLTNLACYNNTISSLDLSANPLLTSLNASQNNLSNLDLTANTNLTYLDVNSNNNLTTLDITNCANLTLINASFCNLSSVDLSGNPILTACTIGSNSLTSIDISNNPLLTSLNVPNNQISAIDIYQHVFLSTLGCSDNLITALDLSQNVALENVYVGNNLLTELNLKNGNNINIASFDATNNPGLTCIQVDDAAFANSNFTNVDAGATFSEICSYCTIYFPDINFKNALLSNLSINTNSDTEIQCAEAVAFSGSIDVSALSISNFSGIEWFTSLTGLTCAFNNLSSLDITNCVALSQLDISQNLISTIDLSQNTQLTILDISLNPISTLDLSPNNLLVNLYASGCGLTSINLNGLASLTDLFLATNQLTTIDLSSNFALQKIYLGGNQISSLDLSANSSMIELECLANGLDWLNVANGNNTNVTNFSAVNNSLYCINVDDSAFSNLNWTNIDAGDIFAENCFLGMNPEKISELEAYPNPTSGIVFIKGNKHSDEFKIFNPLGELVLMGKLYNNQIDISQLTNGVYEIAVLMNDGQYSVVRIVKN